MKRALMCVFVFVTMTCGAVFMTVAFEYENTVLELYDVKPLGRFYDTIAMLCFIYGGSIVATAGTATTAVMIYGARSSRKWSCS